MAKGAQRKRPKVGPVYMSAVAVCMPLLSVFTKRDWRGLDILRRTYPPHDGIIVAANHISYADPLCLAHALWEAGRPPRFLAKESLFRTKGIGPIVRGADQIPVYRFDGNPSDVLRAAVDALNHGEAVTLYPEGTVTRDPQMWPMQGKTGAARMAFLSGATVIPVAQWGAQEIQRPYTKEVKLLPRKTIHVQVCEPVPLDDLREKLGPVDFDSDIPPEILHEATDRIVAAITAGLEQIRGPGAPETPMYFDRAAEEREHRQSEER